MTVKCQKCGKELPDTAKFCTGCGTSIDHNAPDAHEAPQATPTPTADSPTNTAPSVRDKSAKSSNQFVVMFIIAAAVLGGIAFCAVQYGGVHEHDIAMGRAQDESSSTGSTAETPAQDEGGFVFDNSGQTAEPSAQTAEPQDEGEAAEQEYYEQQPQGSEHQLYSTPMVIGECGTHVNIRSTPSKSAKVIIQLNNQTVDLYESVNNDEGKWFHAVITDVNGKKKDPPMEGWVHSSAIGIDYDYNADAINKRTDIE